MKHKQLRGHVAAEHGPQELKSFSCEHDGCAKVFATSQKLRAHEKVHDGTRDLLPRYVHALMIFRSKIHLLSSKLHAEIRWHVTTLL